MTKKMPAILAKHPPPRPLDTLEALVEHWSAVFGPDGPEHHRRDMVVEYCAQARSMADAIQRACDSRNAKGKMHNHQSRVTAKARGKLAKALVKTPSVLRPKNFDVLHDAIESVAQSIDGIGPVTIYDVATRIAAYAQLVPQSLYLHAGVRIGWSLLHGQPAPDVKCIPREQWPRALQVLPADEVEDLLCYAREILNPKMLGADHVLEAIENRAERTNQGMSAGSKS